MTLGEWLPKAAELLRGKGIESAVLEAQVLAAAALGRERSYVLAHPELVIQEPLNWLLERRLCGEPLAYILGWREFYGRRFTVSPAVLIPRQETELLVETALLRMPQERNIRVVDIGTGSGVIAITLKLERRDWIVDATDISESALAVARENAATHGANLSFHHADLLPKDNGQYDLIVSNPPYVAEGDFIGEGVEHEPSDALYAGPEGLDIYRRLALLKCRLATDGEMLIEIGASQAQPVADIFRMEGWHLDESYEDLAGIIRVLALKEANGDRSVPATVP